MTRSIYAAAFGALLLITASALVFAQTAEISPQTNPDNPSASSMQSQPGGGSGPNAGTQNQGSNDSTLEIQRQPTVPPPPSEFGPQHGDNERELQSNNPQYPSGGGSEVFRKPPYLGAVITYTEECFKGKEEHGLEVLSVDPNSPAEKAGLKPRGDTTTQATVGTMAAIPVVGSIVQHFVEKSAQGARGDIIIAVDDVRVHTQSDFRAALMKMKPGDLVYLTVIRPMEDGDHKTLKIGVRLGTPGEYAQNGVPVTK